jgi:hypothetical protein
MTCCFLAVVMVMVMVMVMEWIVQMGFLISISSQPKPINTKKIRASSTPKKTNFNLGNREIDEPVSGKRRN